MATTDDLWGGQLVEVGFNPVSHVCTLRVHALLHGRTYVYDVVCEGVTELRFHNSIPEPWTYAELTEAHVAIESEELALDLILWSEDSGLVIKGSSIEVALIETQDGVRGTP